MSINYKIIPIVSEEAHARILEVVNEADAFPPSYPVLQEMIAEIKSASCGIGVEMRPAVLDPEDFVSYCRILHIPINVANAMLYLASKPG